jgi:hypothetical protein
VWKGIDETEQFAVGMNCRRDYRNRLLTIINFWEIHCKEYYDVGVRTVPSDEYNNRDCTAVVLYPRDGAHVGVFE